MKFIAALLLLLLLPAMLLSEVVLTISKTAFESFNCSMDFTQVIGVDGTTLTSVTASLNGSDATSVIIASSPVPAVQSGTDIVVFRVQGGTVGNTYSVSVKVTDTTNGQKYEGVMNLSITAQ